MSIKIDLTVSGIDQMMEVFKHFPQLAEKYYRPVLKRDVKMIESRIAGDIPVGETGSARKTFGSKVSGRGFRISGRIGWLDRDDPFYPNILEHGAKPHSFELKPQSAGGVLSWPGGFSQGHTINHPGFSARGFMAAGYSAVQPMLENDIHQANENILNEFAAIGKR